MTVEILVILFQIKAGRARDEQQRLHATSLAAIPAPDLSDLARRRTAVSCAQRDCALERENCRQRGGRIVD
jgi:hypothetical protein